MNFEAMWGELVQTMIDAQSKGLNQNITVPQVIEIMGDIENTSAHIELNEIKKKEQEEKKREEAQKKHMEELKEKWAESIDTDEIPVIKDMPQTVTDTKKAP